MDRVHGLRYATPAVYYGSAGKAVAAFAREVSDPLSFCYQGAPVLSGWREVQWHHCAARMLLRAHDEVLWKKVHGARHPPLCSFASLNSRARASSSVPRSTSASGELATRCSLGRISVPSDRTTR